MKFRIKSKIIIGKTYDVKPRKKYSKKVGIPSFRGLVRVIGKYEGGLDSFECEILQENPKQFLLSYKHLNLSLNDFEFVEILK